MLEVRDLNAFYGDSHILHGIDLKVGVGERVAILGRNGAGKSTFLKSLMNAGPTVQGRVSWKGRDLGRMPSHQRAELGLCLVPEDRRILGGLTVLENLRVAYTGVPPSRRSATPDETIERFPMLVPIRDRAGGVLSGGQQQLLALARAAIANPSLLLLDEPTEGLAPVIVEELAEDVMRICEENECTLLLCEQSVWFSRRCTEHVHIIDSGKIVFSGGWDEFDANQDIQARHLAVA